MFYPAIGKRKVIPVDPLHLSNVSFTIQALISVLFASVTGATKQINIRDVLPGLMFLTFIQIHDPDKNNIPNLLPSHLFLMQISKDVLSMFDRQSLIFMH